MSAAKKLAPTAARRRLSEILEEYEKLSIEFDELAAAAGIDPSIAEEILMGMTNEYCDARHMIGDDMPDGKWLVAVHKPMTRAQYYAEVEARVDGMLRRERAQRRAS
jgi:hypothetical protein